MLSTVRALLVLDGARAREPANTGAQSYPARGRTTAGYHNLWVEDVGSQDGWKTPLRVAHEYATLYVMSYTSIPIKGVLAGCGHGGSGVAISQSSGHAISHSEPTQRKCTRFSRTESSSCCGSGRDLSGGLQPTLYVVVPKKAGTLLSLVSPSKTHR